MPLMTVSGAVTAKPTSITQASTDWGPIIRVEREAQRVPVAQKMAAQSPPRIAMASAPSRYSSAR